MNQESLINNSFIERLGRKLSSRAPRLNKVRLSRNNIYIFPSKQGFGFLLLLALMLLTAINYQSSLVYLFTFSLGSIFFVSIWMCFINLSGLTISRLADSHGAVNDDIPCSVVFSSPDKACLSLSIRFEEEGGGGLETNISKGAKQEVSLLYRGRQRGKVNFPRIRIESRYPFGLIVAWTWIKLDASVYVYPKPIEANESNAGQENASDKQEKSVTNEFTELKEHRPGDPINRIVWKRFASRGELVSRSPELSGRDPDWVVWEDYQIGDNELKLSNMCFDVLRHFEKHASFGFKLPGTLVEPSRGESHKLKCLEALSTFTR